MSSHLHHRLHSLTATKCTVQLHLLGHALLTATKRTVQPHLLGHGLLTATKCTEQPDSLTLLANTCSWAFEPLNDGSRDGCTFNMRPRHLRTKPPEMRPIRHVNN